MMTAKIFPITILACAVSAALAQTPKPAGATTKATTQAAPQKTFESPEAATNALIDAASKDDVATLKAVLGSSAKGILTSGDPKQDEAERQEFAKIATEKHDLEKSSMNSHV